MLTLVLLFRAAAGLAPAPSTTSRTYLGSLSTPATADAEAAPLATPKTKSGTQYTLLIDALSLARTSLAEQSRLLGDTQDRVQQLVSAQQRLQELAAVEVKKRRAVAARCQELEALNSEANGDPKLLARVAELRKQVGAIVRECVSHVKKWRVHSRMARDRPPARAPSLPPTHSLGTPRLEASPWPAQRSPSHCDRP